MVYATHFQTKNYTEKEEGMKERERERIILGFFVLFFHSFCVFELNWKFVITNILSSAGSHINL